ncbi:prosaposin-like isoform X1 [Monodelphis domestica]|uniref:prosaposin-like isoform X1 n=1 Tax=Monodelphis domestica TaxID=13616 RepID=UPI0024E1B6C7|nr:prosaposin-like isoform X1 [Monodelphis domestica]
MSRIAARQPVRSVGLPSSPACRPSLAFSHLWRVLFRDPSPREASYRSSQSSQLLPARRLAATGVCIASVSPKMDFRLGFRRLLLTLALCLPFFPAHVNSSFRKEECAKGSEVWCQNFKTASECGAVEHCQQTFWSKATEKSIMCEACMNLMNLIGNFVENRPEEFKEMCRYIGFCAREKETPLQASVSAHASDTRMISALEPEENSVQTRADPTCELCHFISKEIANSLDNKQTTEDVLHAVEKVCSVIPNYVYMAESCRDWVSAYGRSVVHLLLEETDPDLVCGALRVCQGQRSARAANEAKLRSGAFCEVCKMFDGYLDRSLDKNSTQAMILSAFQKACGMLPEAYRSKCDEFVKEYEPILIAALHEELDPASLCLKIGACPKEAAGPPLRTEQCMWGPSYWCKSMETAVLCNAVDHCKNHKWK